MQELQTVLCLDPRDSDTLVLIGNIHMRRAEPEKARAFYARAVKLEPTAYALTNLGGALGELGELDKAIAAFKEALDQDPSYELARRGQELARARKEGQRGD